MCMKCTSGCTVMELLETKPHEIVSLSKLGLVENLINSDTIWTCATCYKCRERCPQKVAPVDLIQILRNIAVREQAQVPEGYMKALTAILETGWIQEEQKVVTRSSETFDRQSLGLPGISVPGEAFKTALLSAMETD